MHFDREIYGNIVDVSGRFVLRTNKRYHIKSKERCGGHECSSKRPRYFYPRSTILVCPYSVLCRPDETKTAGDSIVGSQ